MRWLELGCTRRMHFDVVSRLTSLLAPSSSRTCLDALVERSTHVAEQF
jgi:hypothetical protein